MSTEFKESIYNLFSVGDNNKPINDYIITDDSNIISSEDGSGNIIIYMSNGEGVMLNELTKTTYTDLYIGDEHIAGGFGFKNIQDRNYTYSYISYTLQEITGIYNSINEINHELEKSNEKLNNLDVSLHSNKVSVNQNNNSFYVDDKKYSLNVKNNLLYINKESVFNIYDIKIYYNIIENDITVSENNYISLHENKKVIIPTNKVIYITKIMLNFEHSSNITKYDILYTKTDIYTNDTEEVELFSDVSDDEGNLRNLSNIYKITDYDNNSSVDLFSGQYIIDLSKEKNRLLIDLFDFYDVKLGLIVRLTDKFNDFIDIHLPEILVYNPIYYGVKKDNNTTELTSIFCDYSPNMSSSLNLTINNLNDTEQYLVIYIPNYMYYLHKNTFKIKFYISRKYSKTN
jgi:hypothetical protein